MYVAERERLNAMRDFAYMMQSDKRVTPEELQEILTGNGWVDYKELMAREGLSRREQNYVNIMLTVGNERLYVPFALAHTNVSTQMAISHPELMPYDEEGAVNHEKEHWWSADEGLVKKRARDSSRNALRDYVRVKY